MSMRTRGGCVCDNNNVLSPPIVAEIVHFYTNKQHSRMSPCWRYHLLPDLTGIQEGNRAGLRTGRKNQRYPWTEFHEKHSVLHFKSKPKQMPSRAFVGEKKEIFKTYQLLCLLHIYIMSLTLKDEQPKFGKKSESHNRKRRKLKSTANSFCNIRPEWPLQVSWPEWYPADMWLNGKLKTLNYIIFKTQVPNFPGNRKKKKNLTNKQP